MELMESVCERMEDYGERTDLSTDRKSYIRVKSRTGEAMDLSEATLDSRVTSSLKFAVSTAAANAQNNYIQCFINIILWLFYINYELFHLLSSLNVYHDLFLQCETIVEHHEDEIIEFFAHETENVKDKLCSKRTGMLEVDTSGLFCAFFVLIFCGLVFPALCLQTSVITL